MSETLTTYEELLPAQKCSPHNGIRWTPTGHGSGVLVISTKRGRVRYAVEELPLPPEEAGNRAFRLTKLDRGTDPEGDLYTVLIAADPRGHSCDCKGCIFGNGRPCKHQHACEALIENRWL